ACDLSTGEKRPERLPSFEAAVIWAAPGSLKRSSRECASRSRRNGNGPWMTREGPGAVTIPPTLVGRVANLSHKGRLSGRRAFQRVGSAVGGASPEPFALAGSPGAKRLPPLIPETRRRTLCNFSSMQRPSVVFATLASG